MLIDEHTVAQWWVTKPKKKSIKQFDQAKVQVILGVLLCPQDIFIF